MIKKPAKERERKIGTTLSYIALSLVLLLSLGFIVASLVETSNLEYLTEKSEANSLRISSDIQNIDTTNELYLVKALKSSQSILSSSDLSHILSYLWSYTFYISVDGGDTFEPVTAENILLQSLEGGETVKIQLQENMKGTYLPLKLAINGRLFSDDASDDLTSYVFSRSGANKPDYTSTSSNIEGINTLSSSLTFSFVYEKGSKYTFDINMILKERIKNADTFVIQSPDSVIYYRMILGT